MHPLLLESETPMAANDVVLVDGLIDDRVKRALPSSDRSEVFEYWAFEQILKDADLSHEEILQGMVDGSDDGGIDGAYLLVNGHPLVAADGFTWPRGDADLRMWIITSKHADGFHQVPIDKMVATLSEFLDLRRAEAELCGAYSENILAFRRLLETAYRRLAPRLRSFVVEFAYASRGDANQVQPPVQARAEQLVELAHSLFGQVEAGFRFYGSTELIALHRRVRRFTLELPYAETLATGETYVLLTRLDDFARFLTDESGSVRRYLYDSNVRDFMGLNSVNEDIFDTLAHPGEEDFWWLNNGVTILSSGAALTGRAIQIQDVQIVNGLQTSESIARYFAGGGSDPRNRYVLVKVIVTRDAQVRDTIIRATNNQTAVETTSLRATDPRQRDIEDILGRYGIPYDRRKNYHVNQGWSPEEVVTPLYAAAAFVALVLRSPSTAAKLKQRFMRVPSRYEAVFGTSVPLQVWPQVVQIQRLADQYLNQQRASALPGERFHRNWRHITAYVALARLYGTFAFTHKELVQLDIKSLSQEHFDDAWYVVERSRPNQRTNPPTRSQVSGICKSAALEFGIKSHQVVESRGPFFTPKKDQGRTTTAHRAVLDNAFVDAVNAALPQQPWKPGTHHLVGMELGVSGKRVWEATQILIDTGRRHRQVNGVVFDSSGAVIAYDPERLSSEEAATVEPPQ